MIVSTKGRYALRVLIDLAHQQDGVYTPVKALVERQGISHKYMERIMTELSKGGLIDGVHGKGGGYRLNRSPDAYIVGDILRLTEGSLAPVSCPECGGESCTRKSECKTYPMWQRLDQMINNYFDNITLADLMDDPVCTL